MISVHRDHGRISTAFTLIELLVVVAIISILSAIAVPNFLEAQTRAKVSRVKNDQRTIATALETYITDNNKYPPRTAAPQLSSITKSLGSVEFRPDDLKRLTTPIAYISSIPTDIFENQLAPPFNTIDYWDTLILQDWVSPSNDPLDTASKGGAWALISVGPDGVMGHTSNLQGGSSPPLPGFNIFNQSIYADYDPTNGTISDGNVYRFQIGEKNARQVLR